MGTYYQEVNFEEIEIIDLLSVVSFICPLLVKKAPNLWNQSQASNTKV